MQELLDLGEIRDSARKMLELARARKFPGSELWHMIVEAGWLELSLPQEHGGLDQPFAALGVLYQELGRALAPNTFASVSICLRALAGDAVDGSGIEALIQQTLLGNATPMAAGASHRDVKAVRGRLNGVLRNVLDVGAASHILVPFDRQGPVLGLIPLPHPGVSLTYRPTWDLTRRLFDIVLENVQLRPENILHSRYPAVPVLPALAANFDLAVACDAVGGAQAIFGETLEYMLSRRQFDRPIASFQALKHRCANLSTEMAAACALVTSTCDAFSGLQGDDLTAAAACCRLYASTVFRKVTEEAIQFHGGIGFAWDSRCHHFLKRARLNDVLGGTAEQRKDEIAPVLFRAVPRNSPLAGSER